MAVGNMIGRTIKFEDWKGDTRTGEVVSILRNGDYEVSTDKGMALVKNDEIIKMRKGGGVPKATEIKRRKVAKVMREFKAGKLHSGSKKGPIVKDKDQAIAIALSEAGMSKKMGDGGEVKVGDKVTLPEIKMSNGTIQFEKVENGEVLYINEGIYGVKNPKTNRIHQVRLDQIQMSKGGSTYASGGGVGKYEYKTVDTRSAAGLKEAERLKAEGWKIISTGFNTIQFERLKGWKHKMTKGGNVDLSDAKEFFAENGIGQKYVVNRKFNAQKFKSDMLERTNKSKRSESLIKHWGRELGMNVSKYVDGDVIENIEFSNDSTKRAKYLFGLLSDKMAKGGQMGWKHKSK